LLLVGACSGSSRPVPAPARDSSTAPPAPPRQRGEIAEVMVAVDEVSNQGWGSERRSIPPSALEAAARACLDQHAPMAARRDDAQWLVGLSWDHSYAHADADIVAERSLDDSAPLPDHLADCILEGVPALGDDGERLDALVAIRTAGWVAAHGAGRPVDDPARTMAFAVNGTRRSGCDVRYITHLDSDAVRAAQRCTTALAPARARAPESAWRISIAIPDPHASGPSGFGCLGGRRDEGFNASTSPLPFGDAPAGFADCMLQRLTGAAWAGITVHVEASTAGFRDAHRRYYEGSIGHGR
jgi:hypothetical protein